MSSSPKKITSQKSLLPKQNVKHHEELVFGQSKIIFYDDQFLNDLKNMKSKIQKKNSMLSVNSNLNKLGQEILEKFKNKNSRFHQVMSAKSQFRDNKFKKNCEEKKLSYQNRENIQINLIPSTSVRQFEKRNSALCPKSASRLSNCFTNRKTSRIQQPKQINPSLTNLLSPHPRTSNLLSPKLNPAQKLRRESSISSTVKPVDKSFPKAKSKTYKKQLKQTATSSKLNPYSKFKEQEKEEKNQLPTERLSYQSCYSNLGYFGHQDVRNLFGEHHALFKVHRDYLIEKFGNNFKSDIKKVKKGSEKGGTQKRLQEQLQMLDSIHNSPKCLKNPKKELLSVEPIALSSLSPAQAKPQLLSTYQIQRAPILQYLKSSQAKKLLTLMINPSLSEHCPLQRYTDPEFPYGKIQKINEEDIHWVWVQPNSEVKLFGYSNRNLKENQMDAYEEVQDRRELRIVGFLRCVFQGQPDIIKRLFQPVFGNVFSVWLFIQGNFQPVFVDGYFPLDSKLSHVYGGSQSEFWIPVLIKCICKVKNTFDWQTLQNIKAEQIYKMLTGINLNRIPQQKFIHSPPSQISQLLFTHLSDSSSCIAEYESTQYSLLQQCQSHIYSLNPLTNSCKQLSTLKRHKLQIFVIPSLIHYFVYSFFVKEMSFSKMEIWCPCQIQIVFSGQGQLEQDKGECEKKGRRVYVYETVGVRSSGKVKLVLRYEGDINTAFKCKLRRGNYKIFVQDGQKNIHNLFSEDKAIKWQQKYEKNTQFRLSLLTTHQIKISQIEVLQKKGDHIQDSSNIYQNPKTLKGAAQ